MMKLRPYQQEAVNAILNNSKGLIEAATGAGKTTIMSQAIVNHHAASAKRSLILVHTKALLEQTASRLSSETNMPCAIFFGDEKNSLNSSLIVATYQSIANILDTLSADHFNHIHVDEAHNVRNLVYRKVISYFTPETLHGYTATLEGDGKEKIEEVFGEVIYSIGMFDLIDQGYLAPMRILVSTTEHEGLKDAESYNRKKFETIREMTDKNANTVKTLHFYSRNYRFNFVEDWDLLDKDSYAIVDGTVDREDRTELFARFKSSKSGLNHLLANRVLNEGIDLPITNSVVFHESMGDFRVITQRIGRGIRIHEDNKKQETLIMVFIDKKDRNHHKALNEFITGIREEMTRTGRGRIIETTTERLKKDTSDIPHDVPVSITLVDMTDNLFGRSSYKDYTLEEFIQLCRREGITSSKQWLKVYKQYNFIYHAETRFDVTGEELWSMIRGDKDYTLEEFIALCRREGITTNQQWVEVYKQYNFVSAPFSKFGMSARKLWTMVRGNNDYTLEEFIQLCRREGITSNQQWLEVYKQYKFVSTPQNKFGMTVKELWTMVRDNNDYTLEEFIQLCRREGITSSKQWFKVYKQYSFVSSPERRFDMTAKELWSKVRG